MKNKQAFTMVELIVTILILIILGVIAFMSFQGYSKSSRDSVRIADLSNMTNVLEIFSIEGGKYPIPTESQSVTFSGGELWVQGTFGDSTFTNVSKLDKIPLDPLFNREYTYSVTPTRNQFLLGGITEGNLSSVNSIVKNTYAGDKIMNAFLVGNYNGLVAKSLSGSNCYVLAVPTIISNGLDESSDYGYIVDNKKLVFDGYQNLPSNFGDTKLNINGGFDFSSSNLVLYSDNNSCTAIETDEELRLSILKEVQNSYSGTVLANDSMYFKLLGLTVNDISSENSNNVNGLATNIGNIILGKKIKTSYISNLSGGGEDGGDDLDELMGKCNINGIYIDNGEKITAYTENFIDGAETYNCSGISQERTCIDGVLDGDENYIYTSCVKGDADSCVSTSNYTFNSHIYSIPSLNHQENINDIEPGYLLSNLVYENNGEFQYKLTNLLCNDGYHINPIEDIITTLISCDYGYIQNENTCVSEGVSEITSGDTIVCPNCAP